MLRAICVLVGLVAGLVWARIWRERKSLRDGED